MRQARNLWALWVIGLLLVPALLGLLRLHPNDVESGASITTPMFVPSRLLDDSYYREIDQFVQDATPLQGIGLWSRAAIDYDLFGDSWQPFVASGTDGFLFLRFQVDIPCATLAGIEAPDVPEALTDPDDQRAFVILNTGKHAFYGNTLKSHDQPAACVAAERAAALERVNSVPFAIDVDGALRAVAAEAEVFFPRDTHWSPDGRMIVAQSIIDGITPGLWEPAEVVEAELPELAALGRFLGRVEGTVSGPTIDRPDIVIEELSRQTDASGLIRTQRTRASGESVVPGRTLIIGDSQMAYVVEEFAPYFEDLEFFLWDHLATASELPSGEGVDRIIVQSVETAAMNRFRHPQLVRVFAEMTGTAA